MKAPEILGLLVVACVGGCAGTAVTGTSFAEQTRVSIARCRLPAGVEVVPPVPPAARGEQAPWEPQITGYFPPELEAHVPGWKGREAVALWGLCEPALWDLVDEPAGRAYRLTVQQALTPDFALTVELAAPGPRVRLTISEHPRDFIRPLLREESRAITTGEVEQIAACLRGAGFWERPPSECDDPVLGAPQKRHTTPLCQSGDESSRWVVEAVEDHRYHALSRRSPAVETDRRGLGKLRECAELLGRLGGVPGLQLSDRAARAR
jgi:hypothetical protein